MKSIRAGLERYLTQAPYRKSFSIIRDKVFSQANEALDSHLKNMAKEGVISSTKHKQAISTEDLEKLYEERQLGNSTPESLLNSAWFYIMLYFGRRGRENQRQMVLQDIVFGESSSGLQFITLRERATKNHPGGLKDNQDECMSIMCEWQNNTERCPVRCIKKYLEKRNPQCPALWQKPRISMDTSLEDVWYCNVPLGKNMLDNRLAIMCKKAGLSTHYTSHCIRATAVTILKASGLENARVKSVTGHKSDSDIESYHQRPTFEQQVNSSSIVSSFVDPRSDNALERQALRPTQSNEDHEVRQINSTLNSNTSTTTVPNFSSGSFVNCSFILYTR